jgi:hypothetical protein
MDSVRHLHVLIALIRSANGFAQAAEVKAAEP